MLRSFPLVVLLLSLSTNVTAQAESQTVGSFHQESSSSWSVADGLPHHVVKDLVINRAGLVVAGTAKGWATFNPASASWKPSSAMQVRGSADRDERSTGRQAGRQRMARLKQMTSGKPPVSDGTRSWGMTDALVVRDSKNTLWLADRQGVARLADGKWTLYAGSDGVPFTDFTCAAVDSRGWLWLGTTKGIVRFDGHHWAYRQGRRWLPDDHVHTIAVAADGTAWFGTNGGVGAIQFTETTLADKARFYESEIDKYNRRTEYGYVLESHAKTPGDKSDFSHHDSDNDGLWTSMYGAGECFAWAATKDPEAKRRAKQAFEALRFLSIAPRGGSNPAPRGFIARTVVPTTEPNPNERPGYTLEGQKKSREEGDSMWRTFTPRWPTTEDGRYYWKSDTSSDELDGHYFFNALYFDLVADTEEEKDRVREIVRDNIDHMIAHDFRMHDHEGQTRWANYSPSSLNFDPRWATERGLNSLSMLSYLATAAHITGDNKYLEVAAELRDKHGYAQNVLVPKIQAGIGTGNQSDDEMAFMCFYNLLKYETDPRLKILYRFSFYRYWQLESPELNPFFNFCYAVGSLDKEYSDQWGTMSLAPSEGWLEDSVDTLKRFPLDRFDWKHENSHRIDLVKLPGPAIDTSGRQMRVNGKVIPVDECHFNHWNRNPWQPDTGGAGKVLSCGSVYLLSYYMGLYHGFIAD